jgi:hypothetical protein
MTTHPNPQVKEEQGRVLELAPAESRRRMELMFKYGNIIFRYYSLSREIVPTEKEWDEWLNTLPFDVANSLKSLGFHETNKTLPFLRHILERRGIYMEEFIVQHMPADLLTEYRAMSIIS